MKKHQPQHIYLDNQIYFITSHIYKNAISLDDVKKLRLYKKLRTLMREFGFEFYAYVILDSHYHCLFKSRGGNDLPKIFGQTHGSFAFEINTQDNMRERKIWQNYWDRCIRDEEDFWTHFNYIHHNPVKHKLVCEMSQYKFSSYNYWLQLRGEEWMMSILEYYPVIDFSVDHDEES